MAADGRQDTSSSGENTGQQEKPVLPEIIEYGPARLWMPSENVIGPAPVPDDDGQEHVLVHFVGINGEWLWSSIEPEYISMADLQARWMHGPDDEECHDGTVWHLIWEQKEIGPYPQDGSAGDGTLPSLPEFSYDESLRYASGIERSKDTQEVIVTVYKSAAATRAMSWSVYKSAKPTRAMSW